MSLNAGIEKYASTQFKLSTVLKSPPRIVNSTESECPRMIGVRIQDLEHADNASTDTIAFLFFNGDEL